jgi:RNA polymerase sigma factor (sigma-70 family)
MTRLETRCAVADGHGHTRTAVTASSSEFDAVYRAHAPSVFRRARILLADDEEAQRVVSDVFGLLYDKPERFLGHPALSVRLYALTTRACFSRLRSRTLRSRKRRDSEPGAHPPQDDLSVRATELREVLEGLSDPLAQVAIYYYLDELSQEEVSAVIGCPKQRVVNLLVQLTAAAAERELRP